VPSFLSSSMSMARSVFESPLAAESMTALTGEDAAGLLFSPRGQPNHAGPPIALMGLAHHQASSLESIHRGRDRAAGERDAPPDLVDGRGPL